MNIQLNVLVECYNQNKWQLTCMSMQYQRAFRLQSPFQKPLIGSHYFDPNHQWNEIKWNNHLTKDYLTKDFQSKVKANGKQRQLLNGMFYYQNRDKKRGVNLLVIISFHNIIKGNTTSS